MKRILVLALALLFCFLSITLIACGNDEEESSESKKESSSSKVPSSSTDDSSSEDESSSQESSSKVQESSSSQNSTPHSHSFGEWNVTSNYSCVDKFTIRKTCNCGFFIEENVLSLGHIEATIPSKAATCREQGLTEGKICRICNTILVPQSITDTESHCYVDKKCIFCSSQEPSTGLLYSLDTTTNEFSVTGIGSCEDSIISIPDNINGIPVTSISRNAFSWNKSIVTIIIPSSISSISDLAFENCSSLTSFCVNEDNPNYTTVDGNLFSKDKTTLIFYAIGKKEPYFVIPDNVNTIGARAFSHCESLKYLILPDTLTLIKSSAFYNCISLCDVELPQNLVCIENYTFQGCCSLSNINIPKNIKSIGVSAFESCTKLINITFENGLEEIKDYAFRYCDNLKTVVFPETLSKLGNFVFVSSSPKIFCEAESQPSGWASNWNNSKCTVYWYSESEPTESGNYWHYSDNGEIVVWE